MRSTHACTPSFRNFFTQYSRRLLSILAHPRNPKQTKKINYGLYIFVRHNLFLFLDFSSDSINLHSCAIKKRKKCGAHTHVHHLFAHFFLNIHVGCCLFSHNHPHLNNKKKQKEYVDATSFDLLFECHDYKCRTF